jgi:hypothetical protein
LTGALAGDGRAHAFAGFRAADAEIYLRGLSYLMIGSGLEAAAEFQRLLDCRGSDPFSPCHAVAPLGLARALTASGNVAGAAHAYERFLAGWGQADADVPVLLEAREEYERLWRRGTSSTRAAARGR